MAALAARAPVRPADDPPADCPVNLETLRQDLPYAQRAVIVHQGDDWPAGRFCRNCHARWPCRFYRWGFAVLTTVGWTPQQLRRLLDHAKAGDVPWT